MKLETVGILIDIKPLSERDSLARIFTRDYGVMIGVMRGAVIAKKNRPLIGQVGPFHGMRGWIRNWGFSTGRHRAIWRH